MTVEQILTSFAENVQTILSQYPSALLTGEEHSELSLRFKATIQHYLWENSEKKHTLAKKVYAKLSFYFHPDYKPKIEGLIKKNPNGLSLDTLKKIDACLGPVKK